MRKRVLIPIGNAFGKLVVVSESGSDKRRARLYRCRCECGNEKNVSASHLKRGSTRSCGACPNRVDHIGNGITVLWLQRKTGKEIPCLIDTADYDAIKQHRWCAAHPPSRPGCFYVITKNHHTSTKMHRMLFPNLKKETEIDHISGDGLDNRRCNLRSASHAQNVWNSRIQKNSTSGFIGVAVNGNNFRACIEVNGKKMYLGTFPTAIEAARAYNAAARLYHGEFARLNEDVDIDETVSDVVLAGRHINGNLRGQKVKR
jgi:hypothetical protein